MRGQQLLLHRFETGRHAGTKRRVRTSREDEGDRQRLAFEVGEAEPPAELVRELVVGHDRAGIDRVQVECGRGGRRVASFGGGRAKFADLIDPRVGVGNGQAEGDRLARFESGELVRVLHIERHRHGRHEIRDGFVADLHLFLFGQHPFHNALDLKNLLGPAGSRRSFRRGGFKLGRTLARSQRAHPQDQKCRSPLCHRRVMFPARPGVARDYTPGGVVRGVAVA